MVNLHRGDRFWQVFHMDQLLFFICINDLPNEMKSNAKFVADDASHFTIVKDKNEKF